MKILLNKHNYFAARELRFFLLLPPQSEKWIDIPALRPHIGLRVIAVVRDVPAADQERVQGNSFCPNVAAQ